MRKVITVDGAHLKGKFGGVFLVATAQDANQQIYPLAFAVVDGENDASWDFFFKNLRKFVDNCNEQVFVSDCHKSIKKAISTNYCQAKDGICLFHLKQNVITRCRVKNILNMVSMAAKSYRQTECIRICNEISQEDPVIGAYIQEAGIETWCRSFFPGKRYNIMTSNNAESMNSKFKEAREYPLLAFFDDIRVCLSQWFHERRQLAANSQDHAPIDVEKIIQFKYNQALRYACSTLNAATLEFEVMGWERDEVVRLSEKSCTCMEFDMEEIPCVHALAAAIHIGIDADSLVGQYYTTECWKKGYEMTIYPIPHISEWNVPAQYREFICKPPQKGKRSGRPRKVRIPSAGEFKRRKCSRCGTIGHNKKTCSNQLLNNGA